jgi:hypothetical protein
MLNEYMAVEPAIVEDYRDLLRLTENFGPYSGRYVVQYPPSWPALVREVIAKLPDLEKKRATRILERLINSGHGSIRLPKSLRYKSDKSWVDNVIDNHKAIEISKALVSSSVDLKQSDLLSHLEDFVFTGSAGEQIDSTPDEFLRVSKGLLAISKEIIAIDPYVDPSKSGHRDVLEILIKAAAENNCDQFIIIASSNKMPNFNEASTTDALFKIFRASGLKSKQLEYWLIDDSQDTSLLHSRYLLSIKGGIRYDFGFQRSKRKSDVSVVAEGAHINLIELFITNRERLRIKWKKSL